MKASEFLDAPEGRRGPTKSAAAFLDARDEAEPTAQELAQAERPASMVRSRSGRPTFVDIPAAPAEDPTAQWTGEGGVLESLPAQFVAGGRNVAAQLRRQGAEESIAQRVNTDSAGFAETLGGAVTGNVRASVVARQSGKLASDRVALAVAEADAQRARGDMQSVTPQNMSIAQQAVSSLAQSAAPTLAGIGVGIVSRNPVLAMAIAGGGGAASQGGSTYGEAREKGATHREASLAGAVDGLIEGVGGALPLAVALKPGTPVFKRIAGTMAAEMGAEATTQALQDLHAFTTFNPRITLKEAWHNVRVAALAGGIGGSVYGTAGALIERERRGADPDLSTDIGNTIGRVMSAPTIDSAIAEAMSASSSDETAFELNAPPPERSGAVATAATVPAPLPRSATAFLDAMEPTLGLGNGIATSELPVSRTSVSSSIAPGPLPDGVQDPQVLKDVKVFDAQYAPGISADIEGPAGFETRTGIEPASQTPASQTGMSAAAFLDDAGSGTEQIGARGGVMPLLDEQRSGRWAETVSTPEKLERAPAPMSGIRAGSTPLDTVANEAATSPTNQLPDPTDAQREAENFPMARVRLGELDVSIAYPIGSVRRSKRDSDKPWERTITAGHYGRIVGVPAKGADGENVDAFIKAGTPLDFDGDVFLLEQDRPDGRYDEVKAIIGATSVAEARDVYLANYPKEQKDRVRAITRVSMNDFRTRLQDPEAFLAPQPEASLLDRPLSRLSDRGLEEAQASSDARIRQIAADELERRRAPSTALSADENGVQNASLHAGPLLRNVKVSGTPENRAFGALSARAQEGENGPSELSATGVLMTPPYAATGGTVNDVGRARPDAIRQSIRELLNVPINEGHFKKSRDTLGIYRIKPRTIRVKNQNDIGVISHETGHHFSETSQPVRVLMKTHEKELRSITPYAAQQKSAGLQREEGFAEYLRLAWTQPQRAQQRAPGFHAAFGKYVDQSGHRKAFDTIEGAIRDWENLPPTDRIMAKVGQAPQRPKPSELLDRFIFEALDRYHPVKRMVADLKPDVPASKDPFKAAHLLAGDGAVIEDWITRNTIPFDGARRADSKNYGKPLRDILRPVATDEKTLRDFKAYAISVRAKELLKQGKEHLFTKEEVAEGLKLETPAFRKAADELIAYNDELIDYAVEGGLLSPATADRLRATGAYTVPFFRESEDNSAQQGGGKNPIKRLFGGTENIRDPIANLIQNTANIVHATNRNAVLVKAYEFAKSVPGGGRWIEEIPIPDGVLNVPKKAILDAFKEQGVSIDPKDAATLAQIQKLIVPQPKDDARERIVIVRKNGEPKALQINNALLYKALESFEPMDLGLVETVLSVPADLLRTGVTLSPEFMARNFMRDTLSGFMQSKAGLFPIASTVAGFKEVATRSDAARLYRSFGGAYADMWHGESDKSRKLLERMARRGDFDPRTILTPSGIMDVLKRVGSVSEAGTRVAEFKRTAEPSDIDSLFEAAYRAREVSVDFGMHGANRAVRLLTRITPFLNPAMQGWYKGARTGREQFGTTLLRGSVLTAASLALYMLNRDEEWYQDLENWEKNVYWHFDVGLRDDKDQVIPLRAPKPFEWGAVFGSVPEALADVAIEKNGEEFAKRLGSILGDALGLRAVPTAVLVPTELWANKSMFTGRQIVPDSKERLDPELQYGTHTSLSARELGRAFDTAPAKIDHLIRGFFGTMGVYSVMLADQAVRAAGDYPDFPEKTWRQMPVVRAFVHDPASPNSKPINEFYELLGKARRADATYKRLPEERTEAYFEKKRGDIEVVRDANDLARDIAVLRRESEEVRDSREFSGKEKLDMMYDNSLMIKQLTRDFMKQHKDVRGDHREHQ